jgi:hypothetical protein
MKSDGFEKFGFMFCKFIGVMDFNMFLGINTTKREMNGDSFLFEHGCGKR